MEINGRRVFRYQSIYFDTCDLLFYYQHHRGEVPRWKVRERIYLDTGCTYLELKSKDSRHKIHKQRWSAAPETEALFPHLEALGRSELPVQPELLLETIRTSYSRVTLVQASRRERATVDFNLRFSAGSRIRSLPGFAIFEIKQGRRTRCSALIHKLKESGFHPTGFSKYCIGSVLLDPTLKHNRFKPILRQIQSFDTGELIHGRPHANPDRLRA